MDYCIGDVVIAKEDIDPVDGEPVQKGDIGYIKNRIHIPFNNSYLVAFQKDAIWCNDTQFRRMTEEEFDR